MLSHGIGVAPTGERHGNAFFVAGLKIDVFVANAVTGNDLEVPSGFNDSRCIFFRTGNDGINVADCLFHGFFIRALKFDEFIAFIRKERTRRLFQGFWNQDLIHG